MRKLLFPFFFLFLFHCNSIRQIGKEASFYLLLFSGSASSGIDVSLPEPIVASQEPTVSVPPKMGMDGMEKVFQSSESKVPIPSSVTGNFVPVGKVYDLGLDWDKLSGIPKQEFITIQFAHPVELHYSYDASLLKEKGFMEEFMVFYFDSAEQTWKPVEGVRVDTEKQEVVALTSHFTPFVLTALPSPVGTGVAQAPSCVNDNFSISGTGNAIWTTLDVNFKYYKDRNYYIQPNADYYTLGFDQALGIATCNGGAAAAGTAFCGDNIDHKNGNSANYIQFTAPRNIDVYVMYDSRGPADATWFASDGWTNTGRTIVTTDSVPGYKVYRKTFSFGESVQLRGNYYGIVGPTNINTNYWVVVKRAGVTVSEPPESFCSNPPSKPQDIPLAHGMPGADRATLFWRLPDDLSVSNLLIRRQLNFPTMNPAGGETILSGTEISNRVYLDTGLAINQTYFYTLFTLNSDGRYSAGRVVQVTTGVDSDGDGISDVYENDIINTYDSGSRTNSSLADTDGDGISDWQEIANGTDPTNPDADKPVITQFLRTSASPTAYPVMEFDLQASDNVGITGWRVSESPTPPLKDDMNWTSLNVNRFPMNEMRTFTLYAWVKDAAGNISDPYPFISAELNGLKYPKFVYVSDKNGKKINVYRQSLANDRLELIGTTNVPYAVGHLNKHPNDKFLFSASSTDPYISSYGIDSNSGLLSLVQQVTSFRVVDTEVDLGGSYLVTSMNEYFCGMRSFSINANSGALVLASELYNPHFPPCLDVSVHPSGLWIYVPTIFPSIVTLRNNFDVNLTLQSSLPFSISKQIIHPNGKWGYWLSGTSLYLVNIDSSGAPSLANNSVSLGGTVTDLKIHPNRQMAYAFVNNASGSYVQKLSISQTDGSLTAGSTFPVINQSFAGKLELDSTGNFLYATSLSANRIYSLRLHQTTGDVIRSTFTDNAGQEAASLGINNTNEPAFVNVIHQNRVPIYQGGAGYIYPFDGVIASPDWNNGTHVSFDISVEETDLLRCQPDTSKYAGSLSITSSSGNPVPFSQVRSGMNALKATTPARWFPFGTSASIDYSFVDDPGSCLGGAKTSVFQQSYQVRKLLTTPWNVYTPRGVIPAGDANRQFTLYHTKWGGRIQPIVERQITCQMTYFLCGVNIPSGDITKAHFSCEEKSETRSGVAYGCEYFFRVSPVDAVLLGKKVALTQEQFFWIGEYKQLAPF